MKNRSQLSLLKWLMLAMIPLFVFVACKDDDIIPITNDLRVLFVSLDGNRSQSGTAGIPVTSSVELVFSHGLNKQSFESALSITPNFGYSLSYDETNSFVTITPDPRLEYDETYTLNLPKGNYGAGGESSVLDFNYTFITGEFTPPTITLSPDKLSFFEGEEIRVNVTLSEVVFVDVAFDLDFSGTADFNQDYSVSQSRITIPAGESSTSFTITSFEGDAIEGTEDIVISLINVLNGVYAPVEPLVLRLGDRAPSLEIQGVMHLRAGTANGVRAVHLNVLKDIADLSEYGIEVNTNGSTTPINPNNLDYFFPAVSVSAGDQILLVRDQDVANATSYFGDCFAEFDHVFQTSRMTQNGDDAILLYNNGVAIETFGELGVDGTGRPWEYLGSWGYKLNGEWIYGGLNCANNVNNGTTKTSACVYPMCSEGLEFLGIMSMFPSTGRIRAYHLRALKDISNLREFGVGIASNGQATSDGIEIAFPSIAVKAGEQILVIRDLDVSNAINYFGDCYNTFDHIVADGGVTSNGDDTIELFRGSTLIETYGQLGVDGTGQFWDYTNSWAAKVNGVWTYGGAGCTSGATSNATSSCSYTLCR